MSQSSYNYVPASSSKSWRNLPSEADNNFPIDFRGGTSKVKDFLYTQTSTHAYFACGFFCDDKCDDYLFAIFILNSLNGMAIFDPDSEPKVIWSANRHNPVKTNATLELTASGLVLKQSGGAPIWSAYVGGRAVSGLNLADSGNFLLLDENGDVVWQSFDLPIDSLLRGQKLVAGKSLIANASPTNMTLGLYTLSVTNEGLFFSIGSNPPQVYYQFTNYSSGANESSKGPSYVVFINGTLVFYISSSNTSPLDNIIPIHELLPPREPWYSLEYLRLDSNGHLRVYHEDSKYNVPHTDVLEGALGHCDYPMACGKFGVCSNL